MDLIFFELKMALFTKLFGNVINNAVKFTVSCILCRIILHTEYFFVQKCNGYVQMSDVMMIGSRLASSFSRVPLHEFVATLHITRSVTCFRVQITIVVCRACSTR